jgi:uncharacterized protein (TIGR02266 family)
VSDAGDAANRRNATRIVYEVAVSFRSDSNFYTGFTQDLSTGGLFIATYDVLPIGTPVEFELTVGPQVVKVPVRGVVRWTRDDDSGGAPVGMGVQFVDLHPKLRDRIEAFIERRGETVFYDE